MQMLDDGEIAIPTPRGASEKQSGPMNIVTMQSAGREQSNRNGHHSFPRQHHELSEAKQTRAIAKSISPQSFHSPQSSNALPLASTAPPPLQIADDHSSQSPIVITGELLLNFQRCKRRAFLDKYASLANRDDTSDYLRKLQQDSLIHQRKVLSQHPTQTPQYPARQWDTGFEETLKLMQQGVSHIEKGVLKATYIPSLDSFEDSSLSNDLALESKLARRYTDYSDESPQAPCQNPRSL